jgi:two-component sensor histidine kinase
MAREVNHRVKNNLQMVMSLLGLQAARLSDHQARGALEQTRIRVGAVALVHRLLYDQGEASDRGEVDMRRLTEDLCAQLASNFRSETIALKHACAMGTLSVDKAIPITLFIVEAVTNAYRHGYPEGQAGLISVLLEDNTGQATVRVSDDGQGQDGVSDASTLGMELMDAYASQLGGRLELVSKPGQGMSIAIVIPPDAVAAV